MDQPINSEIITLLGSFQGWLLAEKKALALGFGLTFGQAEVLGFLKSGGPKTVPQMARRLGVSRQNVQVIVNKLLVGSLVFLMPNPDHQLSSLISLTEKGGNVSRALHDQEKEIYDQIFEAINIGEKTLLLRVLKNIH